MSALGHYIVFRLYLVVVIVMQEEEAHFMRLVSVLHDLLVCDTTNKEKRDELQTYVIRCSEPSVCIDVENVFFCILCYRIMYNIV